MVIIGLDTNAFQNNWFAEGEAFKLLADFVAKKEARVYVSEITIREHAGHYIKQAADALAKAKASISHLSKFLLAGPAPSLAALCDPSAFEPAFRKRLTELGIEVIRITDIKHSTLIERDLGQIRPFGSSGKGYRDALIWLGFLSTIDTSTEKVIFVTSNSKDFGENGDQALHSDLLNEIKQKAPGCSGVVYSSPKLLVEQVIKPRLKAISQEEAKTQEILAKLQSNTYEYFTVADIVDAKLDTFSGQETSGEFKAGLAPLEGPIWVTILEDAEHAEVTDLFRLANGTFLCEGRAEVTATVEGFLDKFEASYQSELDNVFISDPNWNDHYSEVEVSNVRAEITFSFEFKAESDAVANFEITKVESF